MNDTFSLKILVLHLKPGTEEHFFFDKFYLFVCMGKVVNFSLCQKQIENFSHADEQIKLVKEKLVKEKMLVCTRLKELKLVKNPKPSRSIFQQTKLST